MLGQIICSVSDSESRCASLSPCKQRVTEHLQVLEGRVKLFCRKFSKFCFVTHCLFCLVYPVVTWASGRFLSGEDKRSFIHSNHLISASLWRSVPIISQGFCHCHLHSFANPPPYPHQCSNINYSLGRSKLRWTTQSADQYDQFPICYFNISRPNLPHSVVLRCTMLLAHYLWGNNIWCIHKREESAVVHFEKVFRRHIGYSKISVCCNLSGHIWQLIASICSTESRSKLVLFLLWHHFMKVSSVKGVFLYATLVCNVLLWSYSTEEFAYFLNMVLVFFLQV